MSLSAPNRAQLAISRVMRSSELGGVAATAVERVDVGHAGAREQLLDQGVDLAGPGVSDRRGPRRSGRSRSRLGRDRDRRVVDQPAVQPLVADEVVGPLSRRRWPGRRCGRREWCRAAGSAAARRPPSRTPSRRPASRARTAAVSSPHMLSTAPMCSGPVAIRIAGATSWSSRLSWSRRAPGREPPVQGGVEQRAGQVVAPNGVHELHEPRT